MELRLERILNVLVELVDDCYEVYHARDSYSSIVILGDDDNNEELIGLLNKMGFEVVNCNSYIKIIRGV